ncbi:glycosyltransferase [Vibrio fluvialis]|uniref:glycosyltransferase n=1 Tax=Vibrio sp. bablab_jr001 TaxID=2755067 RepID=UPI0018F18EE6|nr:glycosyltransferase [Vibrio sp. bablab_jr001]EKO3400400.1 glycosyltransferase [Vibrio fluvialis]EKO3472022.1 glycosyltransferase [Vibrio fluvialis]MBY8117037.1 glycosyltransferase [Vibrio fluvialis]MBY8249542.1 glycosyltransferase [Vibrio fluvialis]
MIKLLYVHYGDNWLRGSEICLLNLLKSLDTRRFKAILWTNNRMLHQKAQELGITSELDAFGILMGWREQRITLTQFFSQIARAKTLIRQYRIQLVHVNSGAACQWMWIAARICRVPMLTQLHSDYTLRDRFRLCLHLSPHVITVSKAISIRLSQEGYPLQNLSVVHNGIDIETLTEHPIQCVRQSLGINKSSTVIASVGSLIHRKGMDRLIQAVASLNRPDLHLLIIGEGPEKPALKQLAAELKIAEQIHFVGEQSEVFGWLRGGVDLFVSGARDEAFGLVLAEAAAAGLPVIAPNVGGIPEVLQHQESALLYDPESPEQLPQYIADLLSDAKLATKLRQAALERVNARFSLQANTAALTSLYSQLLARFPHRQAPSMFSCLKPLKALSFSHLHR